MIKVLSTNITSPLGFTTQQNYQAVRAGRSVLSSYMLWRNIPEKFTGSLFSDAQMDDLMVEGFTRFESIAIRSVEEALSHVDLDVSSPRVLFILSTTKANVDELAAEEKDDKAYLKPGATAKKIAGHLGISTEPIVVCNACISGVTAQMTADRLIGAGHYDYAIVCGADSLSPFVVAGFSSFKSLSPEPCRPFDIERLGLNLGEAAATIVFGRDCGTEGCWRLVGGNLNNDAYHLSAPSPSGEGTLGVIENTVRNIDKESLAMVNVHGTATMFNDQMESKAIERAGLSHVPLTALKGYYGHTLGASGVLETILSMAALDDGCILPVKGFEEIGVSGKITLSNTEGQTDKQSFLKIISGFGGCNGALLYTRTAGHESVNVQTACPEVSHSVRITGDSLTVDGKPVPVSSTGRTLLTEIYKEHIGDYPKFHKMDMFTRLVFVASELLIQQEGETKADDRAIILFNSTSSVVADRKHIATTFSKDGFFPSPSVFLYTLPNIVTGEIAIKQGYKGETSLYILDSRNDGLMEQITSSSFSQHGTGSILTGWVDCSDEDTFEAELKILTR